MGDIVDCAGGGLGDCGCGREQIQDDGFINNWSKGINRLKMC